MNSTLWTLHALACWGSLGVFAWSVKRLPRPVAVVGALLSAGAFAWAGGGTTLPLFWPLLSGYGWLFGVCLIVFLTQVLYVGRRSNRPLFASILGLALFSVPTYATRDEASLLVGSIDLGPFGCAKALFWVAVVVGLWTGLDRWQAGKRAAKGIATYGALLIGALVFAVPFFWLLLTSFKEERDMTNAHGLIWIPKVTHTAEAFDPLSPLYEAQYQGTTVQVEKRSDEVNGIRVSVVHPGSRAGSSFVATRDQLKEVPREMKVVEAKVGDTNVQGLLLSEDSEGAHIRVTEPKSRAGELITLATKEVEPVRSPGLRLRNYPDALADLPAESEGGLRYLENTLFLCIMSVLGTLISCTIVAYGFARLNFPGKNFMFGLLLATMMLPGAVTMLPSFLIFRQLGWVDSLTPIWAPAFLGSAFNIFLLRQFFLTLPKELEDAAKIDGCGYVRTLWSVMAPQIKPALVVVSIWTFIGAWNNFMGPLIYVNSSDKMTIAYAMQLFAGDKSNQPGLLMAFATMTLTPVVLLFFLAQRAFVEGIALTGRTG